MARINLTWRSWIRYLSLRSWGGVTAGLLLLGVGAALAQSPTIIIPRGPKPAAPVVTPSFGPALTNEPGKDVTAVPTAPRPIITPTSITPVPPVITTPAPAIQTKSPTSAPGLPEPFTPTSVKSPGLPPAPPPMQLPPAPPALKTPTTGNGPVVAPLPPPLSAPPLVGKTTPVPPPMPVGMTASKVTIIPADRPSTLPQPDLRLEPKKEPNPLPLEVRPGTPSLPPMPRAETPASMQPPRPFLAPPPVRVVAETPVLGSTPVPTPEVQKEYGQFVKNLVDPQTTLDLVVGRTRVMVVTEKPQRVQVGDDKIITAEELSPTELSLKAKTIGTTVLNLWFTDPADKNKQKILSYLVRVFPDPQAKERLQGSFKTLADEINRAFPESQVSLFMVGDKLGVSGQAKDVAQAAQILRIVRAHAPAELGAEIPENVAVNVNMNVPKGEGVQSDGSVPAVQQLLQAAGPNIVNLLRVPGEQQVMLRVTVAEVNRAAARSIGLHCGVERFDGVKIFSTRTAEMAGLTGMAGANVPVFLDNGQIGLAIHALRGMNLAKSLAEPNLVALNGQRAEFKAGGDFPVPVVTGTANGLQGVTFIPYGVRLQFTPFVTDRTRIRLNVQAEVSTKDVASTANIGGTAVPGLNSRTFQTTVELREGQTMAVAGLIQNSFGAASTRTPGLCEIPGIGRLFAADVTSAAEQELIVLITPELVHPLDCKDTPGIPGSDMIEPSDLEFYLMGRLQGRRLEDYRSPVRLEPAQMKRFRRCEDVFIAGPQGYSDGKQ